MDSGEQFTIARKDLLGEVRKALDIK